MKVPQDDYDIESFCQTLIDTDPARLFEGYHYQHVKTYFYLTSTDNWLSQFSTSYEVEDYGDVYRLEKDYTKQSGERGRAIFFANYYEEDVLMIFTASTEEAVEQTLDKTVMNSAALCEMPIVPEDFQKMHATVLKEYDDTKITKFKSRRIPDLAEAEIRPDYDRTIEYSGEDGRQTLKEFEQYYGVVPVRVRYETEDIDFKIDTSGKFTLHRSNAATFTLLFKLVKEVLDHVLDIQEVSQRIRFQTEQRQSGNIQIELADVTAGEINFNKPFTLLLAEEFMDSASERERNPFTFTDVSAEAGSLDFSATVTDERRGAFFNISATEDSLKIVPKHNCHFPTIVRFYQLVTETIDEQAVIDLFDNEAAYSVSA